jgi:hypothetical protein
MILQLEDVVGYRAMNLEYYFTSQKLDFMLSSHFPGVALQI